MKLEIKEIVKSYGPKEILHNISFEINSSQIMGFLGRNGAGKTTTIRCLMDVFKPNSGQFLLDGQVFDVNKVKIGYLPEERGMYQKTKLIDQLIYFGMLRGASKQEAQKSADYWIERFNLKDYRNALLETLSKGNQQKIQIAQAFLNNPDILILDEPFSGLDPVNAQMFKDAIRDFKKQGKLIIFSSHQMAYVEELCDDITIIESGNILVTGSLDKIKSEHGQNRLIMQSDNFSDDELFKRLMDYQPEKHPQGIIFYLNDQSKSEMLQAFLNQGISIKSFGHYQPSLHDIFVKVVGEQHA